MKMNRVTVVAAKAVAGLALILTTSEYPVSMLGALILCSVALYAMPFALSAGGYNARPRGWSVGQGFSMLLGVLGYGLALMFVVGIIFVSIVFLVD